MNSNKQFVFFISMILFAVSSSAQDYMFVGVEAAKVSGRDYWCLDRNKIESVPVTKRADYDSLKKVFYNRKPEWPAVYLLGPDQAAVMFEVKKQDNVFKCEYTYIAVAYGSTVEEATKKMNENLAGYKNIIGMSKIVFTWPGKSTEKTSGIKTVDYNGVQVQYLPTKSRSCVIKGKNTNKDVIAVIRFVTKSGSVIKEIEINPGGQFTDKVDEKEFNVEVVFKPGKVTEPTTMDKLKKIIKDGITTDEKGEVKSSYTGVRG